MAEKKTGLLGRMFGVGKEAAPGKDAENLEGNVEASEDAETDKLEASPDSSERGKEAVDRALEAAKNGGVAAFKAVGKLLKGLFKGSRELLNVTVGKGAELKDAVVEEVKLLPADLGKIREAGSNKIDQLKADALAKREAKALAKEQKAEQKALDKELAKNTKLREKARALFEKNPEAYQRILADIKENGLTLDTDEGQEALEGALITREHAPLVYAEVLKRYPAEKWKMIGENIDSKVTEALQNVETKMEDWSTRGKAALDRYNTRRTVAKAKRAATRAKIVAGLTPQIVKDHRELKTKSAEQESTIEDLKEQMSRLTALLETRSALSEASPEVDTDAETAPLEAVN